MLRVSATSHHQTSQYKFLFRLSEPLSRINIQKLVMPDNFQALKVIKLYNISLTDTLLIRVTIGCSNYEEAY